MDGLWQELSRVGFDDFRLGLPGNLRPIRRGDMVERYEGMPHGYAMPHGFYVNGGAVLSTVRHFVRGLRHVGMNAEADQVLAAAMAGIADGSAFGGCTSGLDWRTWDGTPCGYEGILADQFGVVTAALERYGTAGVSHPSNAALDGEG